ncbi:XdhC/CoxI family protein [Actinocorallia sp. A-T 12471]|uniref:XdhC family protein n=1 Tax=Actinocorallia sp. A-T 12471 TaxID=3089813 RepID=UPI0029D02634|nr:XdhC/CoxI family protein [Actinocorallia sp. A-T 12471]MDX6739557.1 XdhC/CoxI family protein [Actinocorallia sp. A-T 12471]
MREIIERLTAWQRSGTRYALATVIATGGSAPRTPGAAMAVAEDGEAVGSVSGGCVEGAVYDLCLRALETGDSFRETFGYSDDTAFAVGLTCGGTVEVWVTPAPPPAVISALSEALTAGRPIALAHLLPTPTPPTAPAAPALAPAVADAEHRAAPALAPAVVAAHPADAALAASASGRRAASALVPVVADVVGSDVLGREGVVGGVLAVDGAACYGSTGEVEVDGVVVGEARGMLEAGVSGVRSVRCREGVEVFVASFAEPPRLLVFGAIDYAGSVASLGRFLGYRVTVCDARPVFATPGRFPDAHEVVVDWPHRYLAATSTDARTAIVVLTHDVKFDIPLLKVALRLPVGYVGAMGSRRTHAERLDRLRDAGLSDGELTGLRSPIGLDLGARTPEETAVSILAEIVAARRGGRALPLTATDGPIHHDH